MPASDCTTPGQRMLRWLLGDCWILAGPDVAGPVLVGVVIEKTSQG